MKRMLTNESREASRNAQFEYLLNNGFTRSDYKGLTFFVKDLDLKVFKDKAAHNILYKRYRSLEALQAEIKSLSASYDMRAEYKEKQKANKTLSSHAAAAKAAREELSNAFKGVKFKVTSETFSGGNSIHISWVDGPTVGEVEKISGKYSYGHFNGMEDIFEYSNNIEGLPQVKYVSESREMSPDVQALKESLKDFIKLDEFDYRNNYESVFYRIFQACSIPVNATNLRLEKTGITCGQIEEFYKIAFDAPEQKQEVKTESKAFSNIEKIEADEIQVLEYSEKSFAVIGEKTREIKEDLFRLGGKFNKYLKCGAGYIFANSKLNDVVAFLESIQSNKTEAVEEVQEEEIKEPETSVKLIEAVEVPYTEQPVNFETPETFLNELDYFKIIWHEGRQNPNYTNKTFSNWEDVQKAFYNLWFVNEKGLEGGYTKVKVELKLKNEEPQIFRVDITNKIQNGDFNPSDEHIIKYLEKEQEFENTLRHPEVEANHPLNICDIESGQYKAALKEYESRQEMKEAANEGKIISLLNMSLLVSGNQKQVIN